MEGGKLLRGFQLFSVGMVGGKPNPRMIVVIKNVSFQHLSYKLQPFSLLSGKPPPPKKSSENGLVSPNFPKLNPGYLIRASINFLAQNSFISLFGGGGWFFEPVLSSGN